MRRARGRAKSRGWKFLPARRSTDDVDLGFLIRKQKRRDLTRPESVHLLMLLAVYAK